MRKAINILLFTILSILISLFTDIKADNFFASTLYTISGIMFSVGASMIVTFNLSGIKNQDFLIETRQNLRDVKKSFIFYFLIASISYVIQYYLTKNNIDVLCLFSLGNFQFKICLSVLFSSFILLSIMYYVTNINYLYRLSNNIFDALNK